jgi:hypothetical protein
VQAPHPPNLNETNRFFVLLNVLGSAGASHSCRNAQFERCHRRQLLPGSCPFPPRPS